MSIYSDHAQNVNRINARIADIEADRVRRKGELVGGTLSMLGNLPGRILAQRDQQRAAQAQAEIEADERGLKRQNLEYQGERLAGEAADRAATNAEQQEKATREHAARLLSAANAQNYGPIRKIVQTALPEFGANLPETFPPPDVIQGAVRSLVGDLSKQVEPPKPPEPFTLGPGQQRFDAAGTAIATVPPTERAPVAPPPGFTLAPGGKRFDAQGNLIASLPDRPPTATSGGGASKADRQQLVEAVIANPTIYDTLTPTAKTDIAADLNARGFKFQTKQESKAATGAQQKVLGFFNRAKQASDDLENVEGQIATQGLAGQAWNASVPAFMQTAAGRQYEQSQRAFTEARLRKDSGAAIPEQEFANDRRTYFVQPGDDPVTVKNKQRARAAVLASMGFESGPALAGFYGDEADGMISGYRDRAKQGGAARAGAAPKDGETKPIPGHPGTEQTFRNGKWIRTK